MLKATQCPHCNEKFTFDTDKVPCAKQIVESKDSLSQVIAWHPTCPKCGKESKIPNPHFRR